MPLIDFSSGDTARSADVDANFALCVLTDTAKTISVTHTWSASQTFTGGFTTGAAITVTSTSTPQATIQYDSSNYLQISVSSGGAVTLNATGASAGFTFSDAVTGSSGFLAGGGSTFAGGELGFTLTTASQNVGLYSLSTSSPVMIFDHRASSNTGSWVWRNGTNGGSTQMTLTSGGALTTAGAITVTTGGLTVSAGTTAVQALTCTTLTATAQLKTTVTTQQLALHYDADNHLAVTVSSAGAVTYNATGASAGHTFSDAVTCSSTLSVAAGTITLSSTATVAPLLFSSSGTPSSPANGHMWFDGSNILVHIGGASYTLDKTAA